MSVVVGTWPFSRAAVEKAGVLMDKGDGLLESLVQGVKGMVITTGPMS